MDRTTIRPDTPSDARPLRRISECASHGLSSYLWNIAVGPEDDCDAFVEINNSLFPSGYANAIAVLPEHRRLGVASALLRDAEAAATSDGFPIALSVSDTDFEAVSTYEASAYRHVGLIPNEKEDWQGPGANWLLMVNDTKHPWRPSKQPVGATGQWHIAKSVEA